MNIKLHRQNSLTIHYSIISVIAYSEKLKNATILNEKQVIYNFLTELFDEKVAFSCAKQRMQNGIANSNVL